MNNQHYNNPNPNGSANASDNFGLGNDEALRTSVLIHLNLF